MKFYKLTAKAPKPGYDVAEGFVVAVINAQEARRLASLRAGDEGRDYWLDSKSSRLRKLTPVMREGVILRSYRAG